VPPSWISRGAAPLVLAAVMFGPLAIVPSASSDCGSPQLIVSNGAKQADDGVFVVYKAQIVTIRGTGWSSCTERVGGCIQPSRPAAVSPVELTLVRTTAATTDAPPAAWKPTKRLTRLGTVATGDDYSFAIDQVTMPTHHGHFMLKASVSGDPEPRAVAYVTVL
jgi:hypothetical protein